MSLPLDRVLGTIAPRTLLADVQRSWPRAAGPAFARASRPVSEQAGTVRVACTSAVWAQELDLMSQQVVEALNAELGHPGVKRLRCEVSIRER